ncbi:MAG: sigma-70 family RNA polymerase sigma factor [Bifidobacteriaceae bacterium]|nr:sigma-70 family RNA polymerase sigma factor [Bifidobacteriaceae bacterium]
MTETMQDEDLLLTSAVASDAELISAARSGDGKAFSELYERHAPAALAVARHHAPRQADAEDIVAESFARIFRLLQEGKGPDSFFRAYLFTSVRRIATDLGRQASRVQLLDTDSELAESLADWRSPAPEDLADKAMVRGAFDALPERWRSVLWYAEVEGLTPAQMAPMLGLSANGTAALLHRAREGLRQAFLQEHLATPLAAECRSVAIHLGAWARGALSSRERGRIDAHLAQCSSCRSAANGLNDVNQSLRAVIAPLVLGGSGLAGLLKALQAAPPKIASNATVTAASSTSASSSVTVGKGLNSGNTLVHGSSKFAQLASKITPLKAVAGAMVVGSLTFGGLLLAGRPASHLEQQTTPVIASSQTPANPPAAPPVNLTPVPEIGLPLLFSATGRVGAAEIGGPIAACSQSAACVTSSSATLELPTDAHVSFALLQWFAKTPGNGWTEPILAGPDNQDHRMRASSNPINLLDGGQLCSTDITRLVSEQGAGQWRFTQPATAQGGGWAIVLAFSAESIGQDRLVRIYGGGAVIDRGETSDLSLDLPHAQAERLGFVVWGAPAGRPAVGLWMTSDKSAMAQPLLDSGFTGQATGHDGPAAGVDIFSVTGPIVFPHADKNQTKSALSFRAAPLGNDDAAKFSVGAISVVALPEEP